MRLVSADHFALGQSNNIPFKDTLKETTSKKQNPFCCIRLKLEMYDLSLAKSQIFFTLPLSRGVSVSCCLIDIHDGVCHSRDLTIHSPNSALVSDNSLSKICLVLETTLNL